MTFKSQSATTGVIEQELLLAAYTAGYFPMAHSRNGPIRWYSPDPRAIIPLDSFRVSRSLRQTLRKNIYEIRINTVFERVIRNCAGRRETWISEEIVQSYLALHRSGHAHSVEAWHGTTLAGGLYGVSLGAAFFGESMFSRAKDASKVALVHLVERLRDRGYGLLDAQYVTPHLARFGAGEISRIQYLSLLQRAVAGAASFAD